MSLVGNLTRFFYIYKCQLPTHKGMGFGKVIILSTGTLASARTESALSAFPLRLLYINIVKKQKNSNIIRKNTKKFVIREKSQYIYGEISKYCHPSHT